MVALRMAILVLIAVCAAVTYDKQTFNGATLIGAIAVLALVCTSLRLQAWFASLVEDAHGPAAAERTVLDDFDRPGVCPCPVDHTDTCPLDDDVDHQRAA